MPFTPHPYPSEPAPHVGPWAESSLVAGEALHAHASRGLIHKHLSVTLTSTRAVLTPLSVSLTPRHPLTPRLC